MLATGLAATALLGLGIHLHIERLISLQQDRNEFLQSEIRKFDQQIKEIQDLDPVAYASVSSMFATYLWWKFWQFAGETSLRKDISDD